MSDVSPWDLRWPDPIAVQVAAQRLLEGSARTDLNRELPILARMEGELDPSQGSRCLLVTPWAVERVHWVNPGLEAPPIQSAYPLELDASGRVASGQGVLLLWERPTPVLISWEPETGHTFVEVLLAPVIGYAHAEEVLDAALGQTPARPPKQALSDHLERPVSRRGMFSFLRGAG